MQRTRNESMASCLDQTTKFLNPRSQGYEVTNAYQASSDDDDSPEEYGGSGYHAPNNFNNRVVSGLEDSLRIAQFT